MSVGWKVSSDGINMGTRRSKKVLSWSLSPPQLSVGQTSLHNPYKMLWNSHGVLWPRISVNQSSTRRTCSQSQDADWEHFTQTELGSPLCNAFVGFQDSSPVKSPMRKNLHYKGLFTTMMITSLHSPYKKVFKTLPPGFNVEKFKQS